MNASESSGLLIERFEAADWLLWVRVLLYLIIFASGVIGNVLVCIVVCRQQRLRTSTNFYIVNLACADLAVLLVCVPFDLVLEFTTDWPFGQFFCHTLWPLMTLATSASIGSLTAIAINRYRAICSALKIFDTKKKARKAIPAIWITSFIIVLPYVFVLRMNNGHCVELWPGHIYSKIYTVGIFIIQYIAPLSAILITYVHIALQLRRNRAHLTPAHRKQDRDVAKVVRMMSIVVIIFAICMLPNHCLWIVWEFGGYEAVPGGIKQWASWTSLILYANSCTNPLVYSICMEEFHRAFRAYMMQCCKVREEEVFPKHISVTFERISMRYRNSSFTLRRDNSSVKRQGSVSCKQAEKNLQINEENCRTMHITCL